MNLIIFVLRTSLKPMAAMAFIALLSGAFNAGLIATVNLALHSAGKPTQMIILGFAVLDAGCLIVWTNRSGSGSRPDR